MIPLIMNILRRAVEALLASDQMLKIRTIFASVACLITYQRLEDFDRVSVPVVSGQDKSCR
jgi:hypothetical protein